jgi:hypothetical protein
MKRGAVPKKGGIKYQFQGKKLFLEGTFPSAEEKQDLEKYFGAVCVTFSFAVSLDLFSWFVFCPLNFLFSNLSCL